MKNFFAAALAALTLASPAYAGTNLVINGNFESTTNGLGQLGHNTNVTGWTTDGYNFVMDAAVNSTGVTGQYGNLTLWGPPLGSSNGFTASPLGGNFIGADGAYLVAPISQMINGLVAGKTYRVNFDWAGAQQYGYSGANSEQWEVKLGSQSQFTPVYTNASHGFSGWMSQSFTFDATSSSELLSFIAHGTPSGVPPFALLDGVSVTAAPEPKSWAMMVLGFGALGVMLRRRNRWALAQGGA